VCTEVVLEGGVPEAMTVGGAVLGDAEIGESGVVSCEDTVDVGLFGDEVRGTEIHGVLAVAPPVGGFVCAWRGGGVSARGVGPAVAGDLARGGGGGEGGAFALASEKAYAQAHSWGLFAHGEGGCN
jgi:hypothetical protein